MKPDDFLRELASALDEYRFRDVAQLTDQILPADFTDKQAKKALGLLRRKRLFGEMEKAASLFFMAGHSAPEIRRQRAQALLDQGRVNQGLAELQRMAAEVEDDPLEGPEVRGLIGRAYKQLYVDHGDPANLVKAIQAYRPGWHRREGDYRWHGINLVALLARAERDGVDPGVDDQSAEIARTIRDEIVDLDHKWVWDRGTAMEASIALGETEETMAWAKAYATHSDADAFELASTLRQLKEVWGMDGTDLGGKLIPVLEYELLQREGATLQVAASMVGDPSGFESVYGKEGLVCVEWMDTMYERTRSIARVCNTATGERWGTGFLVVGSAIRADWGDQLVFVTNAHVVSENPADEAPLRPEESSAEFTRLPNRQKVELGELLFSSPRTDLDVSVLRINAPKEAVALKLTPYRPNLSVADERPQRIFVIGHPKGAELAISLYDNNLVGYQGPFVHYRSPTEGGSSGSPVFNRQWQVFALHHRAIYELQANEGVLLELIREAASS